MLVRARQTRRQRRDELRSVLIPVDSELTWLFVPDRTRRQRRHSARRARHACRQRRDRAAIRADPRRQRRHARRQRADLAVRTGTGPSTATKRHSSRLTHPSTETSPCSPSPTDPSTESDRAPICADPRRQRSHTCRERAHAVESEDTALVAPDTPSTATRPCCSSPTDPSRETPRPSTERKSSCDLC